MISTTFKFPSGTIQKSDLIISATAPTLDAAWQIISNQLRIPTQVLQSYNPILEIIESHKFLYRATVGGIVAGWLWAGIILFLYSLTFVAGGIPVTVNGQLDTGIIGSLAPCLITIVTIIPGGAIAIAGLRTLQRTDNFRKWDYGLSSHDRNLSWISICIGALVSGGLVILILAIQSAIEANQSIE